MSSIPSDSLAANVLPSRCLVLSEHGVSRASPVVQFLHALGVDVVFVDAVDAGEERLLFPNVCAGIRNELRRYRAMVNEALGRARCVEDRVRYANRIANIDEMLLVLDASSWRGGDA